MVSEGVRTAAIDAGLLHSGDTDTETWHVRAPALLSLVGHAIGAGVEPLAAIRMAAGLAAGSQIQASAFADMVVGELWARGRTGGRRTGLGRSPRIRGSNAHLPMRRCP